MRDHVKIEPSNHVDRHGAVKFALLYCKDEVTKRLGIRLDSLHTERKAADYELAKLHYELQTTAAAACSAAVEVVRGLDGVVGDPTRLATVVAGIRAWANTPAGKNRLRPC